MIVEKGLALVPKKTRVDWGVARKLCSLTPPVDGSGVRPGKVDWCGGGHGRAEQQCTPTLVLDIL